MDWLEKNKNKSDTTFVSNNYLNNVAPNIMKGVAGKFKYTDLDSIAFTPVIKKLDDYVNYRGGMNNLNDIEGKHVVGFLNVLGNPTRAINDSTSISHMTEDVVNDERFKKIINKLSTISNPDAEKILKTDYSKYKALSFPAKIINMLKMRPKNMSLGDIYKSVKYIDEGPLWPMGERGAQITKDFGYYSNGGELNKKPKKEFLTEPPSKFQIGGKMSIIELSKTTPALKSLEGKVTFIPTKDFKKKTGKGGVEIINPKWGGTVTYDNKYKITNPNPKTWGQAYDPTTENKETLSLDLISHALSSSDPAFAKHKQEFENDIMKTDLGNNINSWIKRKTKEGTIGEDGPDAFKQNELDGLLRLGLFKGDYNKYNYYKPDRETMDKDSIINSRMGQIKNYLQNPGSYMLPESNVIGKRVPKHQTGSAIVNQTISKVNTPEYQEWYKMQLANKLAAKKSGRIELSDIDPIADFGPSLVKGLVSKVIPKLLPKQFVPDPNKFYRTIGKEGYEDSQKTNWLRANPAGDITGRPSDVPYFSKGLIGNYPGKGYVAEVSSPMYRKGDINPVTGYKLTGRHGGYKALDEFGKPANIPIENVTILKKNWLRGYKPINQ